MKCPKCREKCKRNIVFFASKADIVGLLFVCLIIALPVWGVSLLLNGFVVEAFSTVGRREHSNMVEGFIKLEIAFQLLIFAYFYYVGMLKYGKKLAIALSYFLNFKLKITAECNYCGESTVICDLPKESNA